MTDELQRIFKSSGAVKESHFLLASGLHSPVYWEKFRILQYPHYTEKLCRLIVQRFSDKKVDLVVGPTTGGIILAFETARQLGVRCIFAEKMGEVRIFRRDFDIIPGEHILIVDDILTTGGSIRETIDAINTLSSDIMGIGVLVDRSGEEIKFGVPLFSCLRAPSVVYSPETCPLCAAQIPLVKPGAQD